MIDYVRVSVFVFALWAICSPCILSQTAPKPNKEELKITRNVLITDPAGTPVENVKAADLRVLEDGQEQTISDLKRVGSPLNLIMVFDNTGSMRSHLDMIIQTGKFIVRNLRPTDEVQVIRFVDSRKIEVVAPWTADRVKLIDAIENLYVEGGQSAVVDALVLAVSEVEARRKLQPDRRFAVLLVSDCEERGSFYNERQLAERTKAVDVPFFVIGYPNELSGGPKAQAIRFSHDLSLTTGGSAYFPRDKEISKLPVSESLKELLSELRGLYVVSYVPTNQARDGLRRTVKIEPSTPVTTDRLISYGSAFTVPKPK